MKGKLNRRSILIIGGTLCILLLLFVVVNKNSSQKNNTSNTTSTSNDVDMNKDSTKDSKMSTDSESTAESSTTEAVDDLSTLQVTEDTLDKVIKTEIVKVVEDYYVNISKNSSDDKREGIEAYKDINSYIRAGLEKDSYVVFSTYNMKFENIDTLAPGMSVLYLTKGDSGYVIERNIDNAELKEYINNLLVEDAIKKITEKVNADLKTATDKDAFLKEFIEKVESAK